MPSQITLHLSALTAGLTAALFGYSVGFIGGLLVLPSFLTHFHLSDLPPLALASAHSQIVSIWLLGALLGVPLGMPICAHLGRRRCLSFSALLYVLGTALQLVDLDGSVGIFNAGRFLNGLGVGSGTLVSPMYISEIAPAAKRGVLMSGYQTMLQLSALVGFWGAYASNALLDAGSEWQWRIPVAAQLVPGCLLLLGTLGVPETPRFLAERGRWEEAEGVLARLRGVKRGSWEVAAEMEEIRETARIGRLIGERKERFVTEILKKGVRKRLFVGVGLMIAQNMVGLNALNYYAPVIFMSAGFTSVSSSLFLTGIFGIVKLLSAIAFMFIFVKVRGNRFWLKLGSGLCCISMLVLAYLVRNLPPPDKLHPAALTTGGVISVLMVYIFAFSFSVSLGPISWNVCSEIFPLHLNAKCCAITTCTQWLFQIVIAALTPRLLASVGWITYIIYATFCLLTLTWVILYVPETRGVALGKEMDSVFGDVVELEDDDLLEVGEVDERTRLLVRSDGFVGRRRGSLGAYT